MKQLHQWTPSQQVMTWNPLIVICVHRVAGEPHRRWRRTNSSIIAQTHGSGRTLAKGRGQFIIGLRNQCILIASHHKTHWALPEHMSWCTGSWYFSYRPSLCVSSFFFLPTPCFYLFALSISSGSTAGSHMDLSQHLSCSNSCLQVVSIPNILFVTTVMLLSFNLSAHCTSLVDKLLQAANSKTSKHELKKITWSLQWNLFSVLVTFLSHLFVPGRRIFFFVSGSAKVKCECKISVS